MATEAVADVAHGWHVFLLWVCRYYDTQFVEFLMILGWDCIRIVG